MYRFAAICIFVLASGMSIAQTKLFTTIDRKDFRVGQRFRLAFILETAAEDEPDSSLKLPDMSNLRVLSSSSAENIFRKESENGKYYKHIIYQFIVMPKKPGKMKIGSALVWVNSGLYKSEAFDINVARETAEESAGQNIVQIIPVPDTDKVYVKESAPIRLKAVSDNLNFLRSFRVNDPQGSEGKDYTTEFFPAEEQITSLDAESGKYEKILGVLLFRPKKTGQIRLASITGSYFDGEKNMDCSAEPVMFSVKAIPTKAGEKPAQVGKYRYGAPEIKSELRPTVNKMIRIDLPIQGVTDIQAFHSPTLKLSKGMKSFETKLTGTGAAGEVLATYYVLPEQPGEYRLEWETASHFDPNSQETIAPQVISMELDVSDSATVGAGVAGDALSAVSAYTRNVIGNLTPNAQKDQKASEKRYTMNGLWKSIIILFSLLGVGYTWFFLFRNKSTKHRIESKKERKRRSLSEVEQALAQKMAPDTSDKILYLRRQTENGIQQDFWVIWQEIVRDIDLKIQERRPEEVEIEESWLEINSKVNGLRFHHADTANLNDILQETDELWRKLSAKTEV